MWHSSNDAPGRRAREWVRRFSDLVIGRLVRMEEEADMPERAV
jgi:hypothetical protein